MNRTHRKLLVLLSLFCLWAFLRLLREIGPVGAYPQNGIMNPRL